MSDQSSTNDTCEHVARVTAPARVYVDGRPYLVPSATVCLTCHEATIPPLLIERDAMRRVLAEYATRVVKTTRAAAPILERVRAEQEAQKNDPTRKRYPTSGDALSTRKHRPRRTR